MAKRTNKKLGGLQSGELLITLPILGLVLMGVVQFGSYFMQQHRLQSAVDVACRTGIGSFDDQQQCLIAVEEDFYATLGNQVWVEKCDLKVELNESSGERLTVTVNVPTRSVVPNLLGWIGLGIDDEQMMSAQSTMRRS